jgi:hypothetical protein
MEQKVCEIEPKSLIEIYGAKYHIGPKSIYVIIGNHRNHWFHRPYRGDIGYLSSIGYKFCANQYSNDSMLTLMSATDYIGS